MSNSQSISQRNSSNASFYDPPERRSSLLCHPNGVELLRTYARKKQEGIDTKLDTSLCDALAQKLETVVWGPELPISTAIMEAINEKWHQSCNAYSTAHGEQAENVQGELDKRPTSGNPDGVVRLAIKPGDPFKVQLIMEVSVDSNGGEKKIGQAFEYASLIDGQSKTALLFTFHIRRKKSKPNSNQESNLKITQEAFVYLHSEDESECKMGFLWREVYEQQQNRERDIDFLKRCSEGLVRCLDCAQVNRDVQKYNLAFDNKSEWKVVSDNVVINGEKVYKIFDNRFQPTYRRLDQWFHKPWGDRLEVKAKFEFKESDDSDILDTLGYPHKKNRGLDGSFRDVLQTAYPKGSICIIVYKHQKGTHYASLASHFKNIAERISEMHEQNVVHGDIRGFNMLHPFPENDPDHANGIQKSVLIDFDLSGVSGKDKYPPGYNAFVPDCFGKRSGEAGGTMEMLDDWENLALTMALYSTKDPEYNTEWKAIAQKIDSGEGDPCALLSDFTNQFDHEIEFNLLFKKRLDKIACTGTGSPTKKLQKPRGSLSVVGHT